VTEGITKAIEGAIAKCGIPLQAVAAVMIGTTVRDFVVMAGVQS
jgi:hypothetical protein